MLKGGSGEVAVTTDPEHLQGPVFSVGVQALQSMRRTTQKQAASELLVTSNAAMLAKFCDVCKRLNLDPLHAHALPCVVLLMSKSKHCTDMARTYAGLASCSELLEAVDTEREGVLASCDELLSSMGDWLALFSYLVLASSSVARAELETNAVVRRMQVSLVEAQVVASSGGRSAQDVALLALLYLSPRRTPAGKMLERLYTEISDKARDAELRCLRAMTSFRDTTEDEVAMTQTMPLVLRCFEVAPEFSRAVAAVLQKRMQELEQSEVRGAGHGRTLLRTFAAQALVQRRAMSGQASWRAWVQQVSFPVNTSSHMQRLLYFFCVQQTAPSAGTYAAFYTPELCRRALETPVETIDVEALKMVVDSVRLYSVPVKRLIDFSARCLQGINQQRRETLSLVQVLQLYIACFQHESVWKELWRHVLHPAPVMNHTIASDCAAFRAANEYEVTAVAENLLRSLVHD